MCTALNRSLLRAMFESVAVVSNRLWRHGGLAVCVEAKTPILWWRHLVACLQDPPSPARGSNHLSILIHRPDSDTVITSVCPREVWHSRFCSVGKMKCLYMRM